MTAATVTTTALSTDESLAATVEQLAAAPLLTHWERFTQAEQAAIVTHHRMIAGVWRYARATGKADARIVSDDSDEEPGYGFRAVAFTWQGRAVVVRDIFEVQYRYQ